MDYQTYQFIAVGGITLITLAVSVYQDHKIAKMERFYTKRSEQRMEEEKRIIKNLEARAT